MSLADLNAKIAALYWTMERELAERVRVFEDADLATIRREAHKLRGGFPHQQRLTALAAQVEDRASAGDEEATRRGVLELCEEARRIAKASSRPVVEQASSVARARVFRILVVDDDDAIRRLTTLSLTRIGGHSVIAVAEMEGVLEQASAGLYDLIIADAMMPRVGGVQLARSLREHAVNVLVVVLSAAAPEELGVVDDGLTWWRKPISPHELVRRVAALVPGSSALSPGV